MSTDLMDVPEDNHLDCPWQTWLPVRLHRALIKRTEAARLEFEYRARAS